MSPHRPRSGEEWIAAVDAAIAAYRDTCRAYSGEGIYSASIRQSARETAKAALKALGVKECEAVRWLDARH
jgi:hypothetical protein